MAAHQYLLQVTNTRCYADVTACSSAASDPDARPFIHPQRGHTNFSSQSRQLHVQLPLWTQQQFTQQTEGNKQLQRKLQQQRNLLGWGQAWD